MAPTLIDIHGSGLYTAPCRTHTGRFLLIDLISTRGDTAHLRSPVASTTLWRHQFVCRQRTWRHQLLCPGLVTSRQPTTYDCRRFWPDSECSLVFPVSPCGPAVTQDHR